MSDEDAPEQRLEPGARLILQDARGVPCEVVVQKVQEGTIWLDATAPALEPGEAVLVEHRVPGDARYRARAELDVDPDRGVRLLPIERWERDNQRAYVRVRTYGLTVSLSRPRAEPEGHAGAGGRPARYPLLDVSAGGAAIRAEPRFALGEEVVCHFELPGECCFALPARVVRVDEPRSGRRRSAIGVEFLGLDAQHRAALLRWVFREQTRRRHG